MGKAKNGIRLSATTILFAMLLSTAWQSFAESPAQMPSANNSANLRIASQNGGPVVLYQDTVNGGAVSGSTCITFHEEQGPDGGTIVFPSVPDDALPIFGYLYFQYLTMTDCDVDTTGDFVNATINEVNINTLPFVEVDCLNAGLCDVQATTHFYRVDVSSLFEECDLNVATFELRNFGSGNSIEADWVEGATMMVAYCSETSPATDIILIEHPQVIGDGPDSSSAISYSWSGFNADGQSATLILGIGNGQQTGEVVEFTTLGTGPTELSDPAQESSDGLLDGDLCPPASPNDLGGMYDNTVIDVSELVNSGETSAELNIDLTGDCLDSNAAFLTVSSQSSANDCTPEACLASNGDGGNGGGGGGGGGGEDPDRDGDGVDNEDDNCPDVANGPDLGTCMAGIVGSCTQDADCDEVPGDGVCSLQQEDMDNDGLGDVCDSDRDGDGIANDDDGCPDDRLKGDPGVCGCATPDSDTDGDETPDCIDECPSDVDKIEPGACGCGAPDVDSDDNGTLDCNEPCPDNPDKDIAGICGCDEPDDDTDSDGVPDCIDECEDDPNKALVGTCGCGVAETDSDGDETPDCIDECPEDAENDADADGVCGDEDLCPETAPGATVDQDGCETSEPDTPDPQRKPPAPREFNPDDDDEECGICGMGGVSSLMMLSVSLLLMRSSFLRRRRR